MKERGEQLRESLEPDAEPTPEELEAARALAAELEHGAHGGGDAPTAKTAAWLRARAAGPRADEEALERARRRLFEAPSTQGPQPATEARGERADDSRTATLDRRAAPARQGERAAATRGRRSSGRAARRWAWGLAFAAAAGLAVLFLFPRAPRPRIEYARLFDAPFSREGQAIERVERILAWRRGQR